MAGRKNSFGTEKTNYVLIGVIVLICLLLVYHFKRSRFGDTGTWVKNPTWTGPFTEANVPPLTQTGGMLCSQVQTETVNK